MCSRRTDQGRLRRAAGWSAASGTVECPRIVPSAPRPTCPQACSSQTRRGRRQGRVCPLGVFPDGRGRAPRTWAAILTVPQATEADPLGGCLTTSPHPAHHLTCIRRIALRGPDGKRGLRTSVGRLGSVGSLGSDEEARLRIGRNGRLVLHASRPGLRGVRAARSGRQPGSGRDRGSSGSYWHYGVHGKQRHDRRSDCCGPPRVRCRPSHRGLAAGFVHQVAARSSHEQSSGRSVMCPSEAYDGLGQEPNDVAP